MMMATKELVLIPEWVGDQKDFAIYYYSIAFDATQRGAPNVLELGNDATRALIRPYWFHPINLVLKKGHNLLPEVGGFNRD